MSSRASFVSIGTSQRQDAQSLTHNMQVSGGVYFATPSAVGDTQAVGFLLDAYGRQIHVGAHADGATVSVNPLLVGAKYLSALPTYSNGQQTTLLTDVNGRLLTTSPFSQTHHAAATTSTAVVGGVYNSAAPTLDDGDVGQLQMSVDGKVKAEVYQTTSANLVARAQLYDSSGAAIGSSTVASSIHLHALSVLRNSAGVELVTESIGATPGYLAGKSYLHDVSGTGLAGVTINANRHLYVFPQGDAADNAAATSSYPIKSAGIYQATPATLDDGDVGVFRVDANGRQLTAPNGNVADNAVDAGNPIKVGGKYNSTLPTYADGDRSDLQVDSRGRLRTVSQEELSVLESYYIDFSSTNLPGNASSPLEIVAALSGDVKKIQIFDTSGYFLDLMTGAAAAEVTKSLLGPGVDKELICNIASGARVSIRAKDAASAVAVGGLAINFLG